MTDGPNQPETAEPVDGLPAPVRRSVHHRRSIEYTGYLRDDGLWDLEGELCDTKAVPWQSLGRGLMEPGRPVHLMKVRVTVDTALRVMGARASMPQTPFDECLAARHPIEALKGAHLGPGWRRAIDDAMGSTRGCTHLRELVYGLGTLAYQALGPSLEAKAQADGQPPPSRHLDQCISWDRGGVVVLRHRPGEYRPRRGES